MESFKIVTIILAAGLSSRMSNYKMALCFDDMPFIKQ